MPTPNTSATALLVQLLQETVEPIQSPAHLAHLKPELLDYLYTKALDHHQHAVSEARDLLDVVLESMEHSLPPEHQRRLIERADDELASAQCWNEWAANLRFCREHPGLARQLKGDEVLHEAPDTKANASSSKSAQRRTASKK